MSSSIPSRHSEAIVFIFLFMHVHQHFTSSGHSVIFVNWVCTVQGVPKKLCIAFSYTFTAESIARLFKPKFCHLKNDKPHNTLTKVNTATCTRDTNTSIHRSVLCIKCMDSKIAGCSLTEICRKLRLTLCDQ